MRAGDQSYSGWEGMGRLFDAHNHLQDERFGGMQGRLISEARSVGVGRMVVNGTRESDWAGVLELARRESGFIVPSFGVHPWHVGGLSEGWREALWEHLCAVPSGVGEVGLDRWKPGLAYEGQEEVFLWQLGLAVRYDLPLTIHCLRAWGRLLDLLRLHGVPGRGFLLHSYGGAREMVGAFAELGAYFSLPGYFLREGKERKREAFLVVPRERLLIETDAPDQLLPEESGGRVMHEPGSGVPLNHPANLAGVYEFAAGLLGVELEELVGVVAENFGRLFGGLRALGGGGSGDGQSVRASA